METQIGVKALIKSKDNKYLLLNRQLYNPNEGFIGKGLWEIPGGRINNNESLFDALLREIQEETGIKIKKEFIKDNVPVINPETYPYQTITKKDGNIVKRYTIVITIPEVVDIILSGEHKSYKWVTIEELKELLEMDNLEIFFKEWLTSNLINIV